MSRAATPAVIPALAATAALVLISVLGLAGCTRLPEPPVADVDGEVQTLFENYVEALNSSDSVGVLSAYAPDSQVTLAGRGRFFRGRDAVSRTAGESLLNPGQNTYAIDTLAVVPIEKTHALALVEYAVDPADQDIPAFYITATYVLEKFGNKWRIVHAHVSPAREL